MKPLLLIIAFNTFTYIMLTIISIGFAEVVLALLLSFWEEVLKPVIYDSVVVAPPLVLRPLLLIVVLLLVVVSASAQVHVAGTIGASGGLGFTSPSLGISAGADLRKSRIGLSGELSLDRVKKNVGGNGYQISGREALRIFNDKFFVQGGAVESHYTVTKFSKTSFQPLIGIGYAAHDTMFEINFRVETNANHSRILESRLTFYAKRHVFLRFVGSVDNFRQGNVRMTGSATKFEIGWWK